MPKHTLQGLLASLAFIADENRIVNFPDNDNDALNVQLGLWYIPAAGQQFRASIARKTRFATLKDRYSYRLGSAIPNPELEAEVATHYELSYTGGLSEGKLSWQFNFFHSAISKAIQQVDQVQDDLFQLQNTGSARFAGLEIALDIKPLEKLQLGTNYSYIDQKNVDRPEIRFTNVPRHKVFAFADVRPISWLGLLASAEYNSERFSTSYGVTAGAFSLVNLSARTALRPWLGLEAGINNLFDANYFLVEGFPEEDRNYFLTLRFQRP